MVSRRHTQQCSHGCPCSRATGRWGRNHGGTATCRLWEDIKSTSQTRIGSEPSRNPANLFIVDNINSSCVRLSMQTHVNVWRGLLSWLDWGEEHQMILMVCRTYLRFRRRQVPGTLRLQCDQARYEVRGLGPALLDGWVCYSETLIGWWSFLAINCLPWSKNDKELHL